MKKKDSRSLSTQAQEAIRIKAIQAVLAGSKQTEVAEMFGVTRQAVGKWYKKYKEEGIKSLKAKKQGKPKSEGKLKPWQCAQIAKIVIDRNPEQLKLPFSLWTREAVAKLIKDNFGIALSRWTVGRYLKKWGFTPQKPLKKAYEQNPKAVDKWLKEDYPTIKDRARKDKATIYWGDEMGLQSNHIRGRTYGKKGQTPVITTTAQRLKCNVISAITNHGKLSFKVFKDKFDYKIFIDFLKRLIKNQKHKIFLIIDNYSSHKQEEVKKWVEANKDKIELFFLPTYSPELNPNELTNQVVKANIFKKERPKDNNHLILLARKSFCSLQHTPNKVVNFFKKPCVAYAKA
ncbi:MAG: IS630 family transposase [Candidatus Omnitrophota bacterium]